MIKIYEHQKEIKFGEIARLYGYEHYTLIERQNGTMFEKGEELYLWNGDIDDSAVDDNESVNVLIVPTKYFSEYRKKPLEYNREFIKHPFIK